MPDDKTDPVTPPAPILNGHPPGESVEALKRRVAELEAALAKMTRQRDETRRMLFELHAEMLPDDPPPTEEELLDERKTRTEQSISEMLAELEKEAGATGA
jgi:hypothetical protein